MHGSRYNYPGREGCGENRRKEEGERGAGSSEGTAQRLEEGTESPPRIIVAPTGREG